MRNIHKHVGNYEIHMIKELKCSKCGVVIEKMSHVQYIKTKDQVFEDFWADAS